jgi:hexosaminidase
MSLIVMYGHILGKIFLSGNRPPGLEWVHSLRQKNFWNMKNIWPDTAVMRLNQGMNLKSYIIGMCLVLASPVGFAADASAAGLVPVPQKMTVSEGAFKLAPDTRIYVDSGSRATGEFLAARLRKATGYPLKVRTKSGATEAINGAILLTTNKAKADLGAEGYELMVATNSVILRAPAATGLFYGSQTVLQLLPPEILATNRVTNVDWQMPCAQIEDWPRFKWRGLMLDVSRHFYTKPEVEQVLDLMAQEKLNTFHWHLVDDQGWRIEIKKYPRLTEIGAWRTNIGWNLDPKSSTAYGADGRYGGFYTQKDIRAVVAYAAARHITVVPEIEMPGHSSAALTAYPQFSCTGGPYSTEPNQRRALPGVYCAGNDATFEFLQNVLTEVFQLFPGPYIHIGGDEVSKANWKKCDKCQARMKAEGLKNEEDLQSYFISRMEKFVNANGRTLIGWSEILQGGLAQNAVLMDWIGGGKQGASAGHDVVMTPEKYCYLDHYQSTNRAAEPLAIGGKPIPLSLVYSFEPIPEGLDPQFDFHVLGPQGNVWTEWISNLRHMEYMIFPRLCALSEAGWSAKEARNWDDFMVRLPIELKRFDEQNVNYRHLTVDAPQGLRVISQPDSSK